MDILLASSVYLQTHTEIKGRTAYTNQARDILISGYPLVIANDVRDIEIRQIGFRGVEAGSSIRILGVAHGGSPIYQLAGINIHHNTFNVSRSGSPTPPDRWAITIDLPSGYTDVAGIEIHHNMIEDTEDSATSHGIKVNGYDTTPIPDFSHTTAEIYENCFADIDWDSIYAEHGVHVLSWNNVFYSWSSLGVKTAHAGEFYSDNDMYLFDPDEVFSYAGLYVNYSGTDGLSEIDGTYYLCPDGFTKIVHADNALCDEDDYCCEDDEDPSNVLTMMDVNNPGGTSVFNPGSVSSSTATLALADSICDAAGNPND